MERGGVAGSHSGLDAQISSSTLGGGVASKGNGSAPDAAATAQSTAAPVPNARCWRLGPTPEGAVPNQFAAGAIFDFTESSSLSPERGRGSRPLPAVLAGGPLENRALQKLVPWEQGGITDTHL